MEAGVRICVVVTARPSWTKLLTICEALRAMPDVELQIIACASALLERYGNVAAVIERAGFQITERVWSVYEGSTLQTSAMETGALCSALAGTFTRLRPDAVLVMADRHEVLAAAQAASYLHITTAHCQGGEKTGSIDDKVRDSITALADYHFTATERARYRVYGLTGAVECIWNTGCPSIDLAARAQQTPLVTDAEIGGTGRSLDLDSPFALVLQHPVTSEASESYLQMQETLEGLPRDLQAVVFWPGEDAGSEAMSKAIREHAARASIRTVRNLPPDRFLRLMGQCAVIVGNSSASIREASYLGVPSVVIGSRQMGRERGANVLSVPHHREAIGDAIRRQVFAGFYPSDDTYGRGDSGRRIAELLARVAVERPRETPTVLPRASVTAKRSEVRASAGAAQDRPRIPGALPEAEA